jgi:pimeloyl-ACP methyl ester carboxylesterase
MDNGQWGVPAADPIGAVDASFSEAHVPVGGGVSLRVMHWLPQAKRRLPPLLFVAGWISVVQGWADFLRAAAARRPVFYVESREKVSARFQPPHLSVEEFTIRRSAEDLLALCRALPLDLEQTIVAGSSFGATSLLEALKGGRLRARAAFLVGPNSEFRLPWSTHLVVHLPNVFFHVVKHAIIWHLRTFRVDAEAEPEQMQRYEQTVLSADPGRLKLSARAIMGYQVWSALETVTVPVALAYAPSDKLHGAVNVQRIAETLPRCSLIRCSSNLAMHSAELVDQLERFVAELDER